MGSVEDDLKETLLKGSEHKSDLANTCELLLNDQFRRRKTFLRDKLVSSLSTLETIAELYDVQFLKEWITAYTEYVTSVDGGGRKDIVDIAKYSIDRENDMRKELLGIMGKR